MALMEKPSSYVRNLPVSTTQDRKDMNERNYSDTHYTTQQTLGSPSRARRMAEKG